MNNSDIVHVVLAMITGGCVDSARFVPQKSLANGVSSS